jgi:hypothetical protein
MKTMFAFVAAFALPLVALACSASPDTQNSEVPAVAASGTHPQAINEGGCSPEQLALGWYEVDGECYGPGARSSDVRAHRGGVAGCDEERSSASLRL